MNTPRAPRRDLDPDLRSAVVAFLREWLPAPAAVKYRKMMLSNPAGWSSDPHFAGGIIVNHALRGNGITEEVLGIADLEPLWPELLRLAVLDGSAEDASDLPPSTGGTAGEVLRSEDPSVSAAQQTAPDTDVGNNLEIGVSSRKGAGPAADNPDGT